MGQTIKIGNYVIGDGQPCFVIAEIGINHNGDVELARQLIDEAVVTGFDAVKFQKRTVDVVYTPEELARPRVNPFGELNGDLKRGLEFDQERYQLINSHCQSREMLWFASAWDEASVDFLEQFDPPCYKIASASLTDDHLLKHHRQYDRPMIVSTGMSTLEEIDHAVDVLGTDNLLLMHCTSTYPSQPRELNLRVIQTLKQRYQVPIGYSGHETGLAMSTAAVAMGACALERHITLGRTLWGSDQSASIEPPEMEKLLKAVRSLETAQGDGVKRVYDSELPIREKLRRVG